MEMPKGYLRRDKKVTRMPKETLKVAVLRELRRTATVTRLLGSGDPRVAHSRLVHLVLDLPVDRNVRAATKALGLSSEFATVLDRLVEAGDDLGVDQRQARRYSDKGLETVAQLISTNWAVESTPSLTAALSDFQDRIEMQILTTHPPVVEMSSPVVTFLVGQTATDAEPRWVYGSSESGNLWSATSRALTLQRTQLETSIAVVWRGELWPKFTVDTAGIPLVVETLGNKVMLRIGPVANLAVS